MVIERLVVFGGTGDLTRRYLLPALAAVHEAGGLGEGFELVCVSRRERAEGQFRDWVTEQLDDHAPETAVSSRRAVAAAARYRAADVRNPQEVARVIAGTEPIVVYLALPPELAPAAIAALGEVGMPAGSRIVLEKPFGEDLASARSLNRQLADLVPEESVFRVDHFLAMRSVQNILGSRLANPVLASLWSSEYIERIEIVWDETLALEDRAEYYDTAGAFVDMVQSHLLQVLCMVAMEPPKELSAKGIRDRKVDVLRSIHPLTDDDVRRRTRRARYDAGRIGARRVPAYVDEPGVDSARGTETFAEIDLTVDNARWSGTTFTIRTGKALGVDRQEVVVRFRFDPAALFGAGSVAPNVLRFGLVPDELTLAMNVVGDTVDDLVPVAMSATPPPPGLPAYGRLLRAVFRGDPTLYVRGDEAEQAWRVVAPVLAGWSRDLVPLEEYPAGSSGPSDGDDS